MKALSRYQVFSSSSSLLAGIIQFLLHIVLVVVVAALGIGVFKAGYDLVTIIHTPLQHILQTLLADIVFVIAVVEIAIILLNYLKEGRIILRYIVDAILIIMTSQVVSLWFNRPNLVQAGSLAIIIAALVFVRLGVMYIESNSSRPA